ncbi:MAG: hypothetical protein ACRDSE_09520 [Pseudonocardiaceae bacterium]
MRIYTMTRDPGYPLSIRTGRGDGTVGADRRTHVAPVWMRRRRDVELARRAVPVFSAAAASAGKRVDVPTTGQVCVPLSARERSP